MLQHIEEKIHYRFHNRELLRQALTHSSYTNEHRLDRTQCNERLEFLGDAVLELSSSEFLYEHYSDQPEGVLTKLRASIVCEPTLANIARTFSLGDFLFLGKGEDATGGRQRDSIISDALEAVIGAIYLDGGFTSAKEFVLRFIMNDIEHKKLFFDSKTILQEVVQAKAEGELSYQLIGEEGPDHDKKFIVEARIGTKTYGQGIGKTKKGAEQEAAYHTLLELKKQESSS